MYRYIGSYTKLYRHNFLVWTQPKSVSGKLPQGNKGGESEQLFPETTKVPIAGGHIYRADGTRRSPPACPAERMEFPPFFIFCEHSTSGSSKIPAP